MSEIVNVCLNPMNQTSSQNRLKWKMSFCNFFLPWFDLDMCLYLCMRLLRGSVLLQAQTMSSLQGDRGLTQYSYSLKNHFILLSFLAFSLRPYCVFLLQNTVAFSLCLLFDFLLPLLHSVTWPKVYGHPMILLLLLQDAIIF